MTEIHSVNKYVAEKQTFLYNKRKDIFRLSNK